MNEVEWFGTKPRGQLVLKLRTLGYYFRQALLGLRRSGWLTVAAVITVSISLFLVGLFSLLVFNVNLVASAVESEVEVAVFLDVTTPKDALSELQETFNGLPGVQTATLISKEEGLRELEKQFGQQSDLTRALGGKNPLPDYFKLKTDNPADVPAVAAAAKEMRYVEEVKYGQGMVERLFQITAWIRLFGTAIIILLGIAAVTLVAIAIRMTVFARRQEIGVMKFVGASDWFIRWPFFLEGMLLGLFGGVIAGLVLEMAYGFVVRRLEVSLAFLPHLASLKDAWILVAGLVVGGIVLGSLGSLISVRRFLRV